MRRQLTLRCLKICMFSMLSLWLFGCTSSPHIEENVTYYIFDANPLPQTTEHASNLTPVNIAAVKLPRYLSGDHLIMQSQDHSFVRANYHSWADNLDAAIKRAIISDVNQTNSKFYAVNKCQTCTSITVHIEHFYPTDGGDILLSGYTEQNSGNSENKITRFYYKTALESAGYANAVKQMRKQVSLLTKDVLKSLDK